MSDLFEKLTADERHTLATKLANATTACSGRACGNLFTESTAERAAYAHLADEIRPIRDEVYPIETDAEWLYGNSPAGLRMQAAEELAREFGTDVGEWLV